MISVILLNYKRPDNVHRILERLEACQCVDDVIVWNNEGSMFGGGTPKIRYSNADRNWGLFPRHAMGLLAKNDCILFQDDDLLLTEDTITRLYNKWKMRRLAVHGLFGRRPKMPGFTYAEYRDHDDEDVEIVLGRCQMFHRSLLPKFFHWLDFPQIKRLLEEGKHLGCLPSSCDDIILSYVAQQYSRQLNRVHNFERTDLPAGDEALAANPNHFKYREQAMRKCAYLKEFYVQKA